MRASQWQRHARPLGGPTRSRCEVARVAARWIPEGVRAVRFAFLALPVLAIASCSGKDPLNPGTPIGTFRVDGKLVSNACGAAESAPDPWEFDVKLSRDHGTVYLVQGGTT